MPGLTPRREIVSMKSSNWRRVIASSDSAFAKCVQVPANRVPRDSSMYWASAGLDDREELGALGQVAEDAGAVGADRAEVDVGPAERVFQECAATGIRRRFARSAVGAKEWVALGGAHPEDA